MKSLLANKKVLAWALYDFADQAFSALFITFFFPILIKVHLGGNELQIGLSMGLSVLLAALLVPFIGALSDISGKRIPILALTAFLTAIIAILVGYAPLLTALILAFLANVTHLISKDVYDAKMIELVHPSRFGTLSGLGLAFGYLGTILSLALAYPFLSHFGWESISGLRAVFFESALWYIIFSLPLFFMVPDMIKGAKAKFSEIFKKGLLEVGSTIKNLPNFPALFKFLAASFFYGNAMNTVVIFLGLYGREVIGLGVREFFSVFALMALAAGFGSLLFGKLADRFGPERLIRVSLYVWIGIVIFLIRLSSYSAFLFAGILGGVVFGAVWTLNRHFIARVSPEEKIAQLFGFEGLTEKFSGVLGPIIFGYLALIYGYTPALASMILFFLLGLFLMRDVKSA